MELSPHPHDVRVRLVRRIASPVFFTSPNGAALNNISKNHILVVDLYDCIPGDSKERKNTVLVPVTECVVNIMLETVHLTVEVPT
jgi:hypothetical protein